MDKQQEPSATVSTGHQQQEATGRPVVQVPVLNLLQRIVEELQTVGSTKLVTMPLPIADHDSASLDGHASEADQAQQEDPELRQFACNTWMETQEVGELTLRFKLNRMPSTPPHSLDSSAVVDNWLSTEEKRSRFVWDNFNMPNYACMDLPSPDVNCRPYGLACDVDTGKIYVSYPRIHEVRCFKPRKGNFVLLFSFGGHGRGPGCLIAPTGIAVDAVHERLFVADKDNHRICIFKLDGEFVTYFGSFGRGDGEFRYPWSVAVSHDGRFIAVTDSGNWRVQLFDSKFGFIKKCNLDEAVPKEFSGVAGELVFAHDITFNRAGTRIYVSDTNSSTVLAFNSDLCHKRRLIPDGLLRCPLGLAMDLCDNVVICDSQNDAVRVVRATGSHVRSITKPPGHQAFNPINVTTLKEDRIAVLDERNKIVLL